MFAAAAAAMATRASAQTAGKAMTTASGLQIIDSQVGTGASPKLGQTCVMHYYRVALRERAEGQEVR